MTSLRRAILGRTLLMLMAVGVLASLAAYGAAIFEANQFMDDYLRQFASTIAPQTDRGAPNLREPEDRLEKMVWRRDGSLAESTPNAPTIAQMPKTAGFKTFDADGETWRAFTVKRQDTIVMLAQRMSARKELALHAAIEVLLVILAVIPLVGLIVLWTVGRVMRRLRALGASIAARSVDAKDPLPAEGLPLEISPLVAAMNVLIERQQTALQQQRRFIADSAHELRTPLTALRLQIDNLRAAEGAAQVQASAALHDGIARASAMLNQLLRLARFDALPDDDALDDIDLRDVLQQCVADVIGIADAAGVDIGLVSADAVILRARKSDMQTLLANIIDNAIAYTPPGGSVDCTLQRKATTAELVITDTGPGVPAADLPRLFDRFFRAASSDTMGSGLGLAIVKAIADRYKIEVTIENRTGRSGLSVRLVFPATLRSGAS